MPDTDYYDDVYLDGDQIVIIDGYEEYRIEILEVDLCRHLGLNYTLQRDIFYVSDPRTDWTPIEEYEFTPPQLLKYVQDHELLKELEHAAK